MSIPEEIRDRDAYQEGLDLADQIGNFANDMRCPDGDRHKGFIDGLQRQHLTLQQNIMKMIMKVIFTFAEPRYTDLRNAATVELAKKIKEHVEDDCYLPTI
jgi:hypothetical protein